MRFSTHFTCILVIVALNSALLKAQSISTGQQTIDGAEFAGLVLNQKIPEKYLNTYWEDYLKKFEKVRSRRSVYTINKAAISSISTGPVKVTSQVKASQIFVALNAGGNYITNFSDDGYRNAEVLLKDFSDYAAMREEVRAADALFSSSEKSYLKLQRENESTAREIERTEKKLIDLRSDLQKKKVEEQNSLLDLQKKQKSLELFKGRLPVVK